MTRLLSRARTLTALATCALLAACATPYAPPVPANDPVTLRVNVFRGASNIPIYLSQDSGAFTKRGITLAMEFTPDSIQQRTGLAAGRFDIAHSAVDNAVAMVETAGADIVIVGGGEGGMNEFLVRPEIERLTDLRGRALGIDAPDTAYALIGRKILKDAGLMAGRDYQLQPAGGAQARSRALDTPAAAAVLLNPPWNFVARERGAKSLGSTMELFGPYQANAPFVRRAWAQANGPALERYLAAYIEGCRAALDPAQRDRVLRVLARELGTDARVAELTYTELTRPGSGLAKDCAFNQAGFRNVLSLRAEIMGQWGGKAPAPDKYLDLQYFERALRHAGTGR